MKKILIITIGRANGNTAQTGHLKNAYDFGKSIYAEEHGQDS